MGSWRMLPAAFDMGPTSVMPLQQQQYQVGNKQV
jgi:hypothetical protein